ncbi:hypothetical protein C8D03_3446 [Bosea sp. 124]|nr:hypothetical protein C8D03_3446 [Bosea sp. 124]
MKAGTWQRRISVANRMVVIGALAVAAFTTPAFATTPGLPAGLPELPSLDEGMQRDPHSGLALRGYDPVAYRIEKHAMSGHPDYEIVHQGAVWRFVSAANREAFRDAPDIYEPAFDGFDASAVAEGRAVDTDPRQFAVIGSRLFLFRTPENRRSFVEDANLLKTAETKWDDVSRSIAR